MYQNAVHLLKLNNGIMLELSVNKFRANIKGVVDKAIEEHQVIRINRRSGKDFIVISAEDWEREQETLYVLRNKSLMSQIAESLVTFEKDNGYKPTQEQLDAINNI
ncbi:MAG TPA: prevent-host-death protein [Prolixibacteraceae bacterium]|jgi:antitoxin YefM|nr:prevent-host-death protein [Prolixibacteraceae bacterium]